MALLVTDITYFASRFEDRIARVPTVLPLPPGITATNIAGVSPRQGVELAGTLNAVDVAYAWSRPTPIPTPKRRRHCAKFDGRKTLDLSPQRSVSPTTRHAPASPSFKTAKWMTMHFVAASGQHASFLAPTRSSTRKSTHQVTPYSRSLYFRGENLFNEKYEEVFRYRSPGATVMLGLRMRLGRTRNTASIKRKGRFLRTGPVPLDEEDKT